MSENKKFDRQNDAERPAGDAETVERVNPRRPQNSPQRATRAFIRTFSKSLSSMRALLIPP